MAGCACLYLDEGLRLQPKALMLADDSPLRLLLRAHRLEHRHLPLLDQVDRTDELSLDQDHLAGDVDHRSQPREHAQERRVGERVEKGRAAERAPMDGDGEARGERRRQVVEEAEVLLQGKRA